MTLMVAAAASYTFVRVASRRSQQTWNTTAVTATYRSTQLKEIDPANAGLLVSYDLHNRTDNDYRFADGPGVTIMTRIKPDRSLSSQEDIKLAYPAFLPARQTVRITLQMRHSFQWPAQEDSAFENKLKEFVNQRLVDVEEFVMFDQVARCQISLPQGWQELKLSAAAQPVKSVY